VTNVNVSTEPTIDLNFGADVLQLDTMEVEPDNVQMKTFDSQPEVEQLKDSNKLSGREERAAEVCLDKLLEVMSVYWWLYDQTLKTGHAADLTVRVYGRWLSIKLSTYQLLRQYQWLNHEVISVYMTLLDKHYNRLPRYEDFVTIRELSKYYSIIPDTQMLVDLQRIARGKHTHPIRHQVKGVDDGLQSLKPPLDTGRLLLPHLDLPDLRLAGGHYCRPYTPAGKNLYLTFVRTLNAQQRLCTSIVATETMDYQIPRLLISFFNFVMDNNISSKVCTIRFGGRDDSEVPDISVVLSNLNRQTSTGVEKDSIVYIMQLYGVSCKILIDTTKTYHKILVRIFRSTIQLYHPTSQDKIVKQIWMDKVANLHDRHNQYTT
ncbi:hypothetical protein IFM89_032985, partial [Coptis chinensis]